jgi:Flp pilus assembly protein TadG
MPARSKGQSGAVLPLIAVCLVVLIGITALAVDIGHLLVVRNELQNASDSGALAGTQALYEDPDGAGLMEPGDQVNTGANQVAYDAAVSNRSEKIPVEVNQPILNTVDVQRGHWNMSTRTFTQSDEIATFNLFGISEEDLDRMDGTFEYPPGSGNYPVMINAVRVVTRREQVPAASFFAGIFGFQDFGLRTEAIAYVGYASHEIEVAGVPIVICQQSLDNGGDPTCNIGRMINSGNDTSNNNTAGWSNFDQSSSTCSGSNPNANELNEILDGCGASLQQVGGGGIPANGGMINSVYATMYSCWQTNTGGTEPWTMTLPLVDCSGSHNIGNCPLVVGAVAVNILWMTSHTGSLNSSDAPTQMEPDWDFNNPPASDPNQCSVFQSQVGQDTAVALQYFANYLGADYPNGLAAFSDPERWPSSWSTYDEGMARWDCFVDHFDMLNADGGVAPLASGSIYFAPDCEEVQPPTGATGGSNFGVMAKRPVLVQ